MLRVLDEVLNLRLPSEVRAALDGEARAADVNISVVARRALVAGLVQIRNGAPADMPPPDRVSSFQGAAR